MSNPKDESSPRQRFYSILFVQTKTQQVACLPSFTHHRLGLLIGAKDTLPMFVLGALKYIQQSWHASCEIASAKSTTRRSPNICLRMLLTIA